MAYRNNDKTVFASFGFTSLQTIKVLPYYYTMGYLFQIVLEEGVKLFTQEQEPKKLVKSVHQIRGVPISMCFGGVFSTTDELQQIVAQSIPNGH